MNSGLAIFGAVYVVGILLIAKSAYDPIDPPCTPAMKLHEHAIVAAVALFWPVLFLFGACCVLIGWFYDRTSRTK